MSTKKGDNNDKVLEENINVVVRCRPMNTREIEANESCIVECHPNRIEIISKNKIFNVDKVFGPESTQEQIYREVVSPMVHQTLNGYNCTIFAYGQTGTGKTYTIEGLQENESNININMPQEQVGMLGRAVRQIFQSLSQDGQEYTVKVSHFEVYNEVIYDLINPTNTKLKLYDDPNHLKGVHIHGLEESPVKSVEELFGILEKSWEHQRKAETERNESSSRSHCIISFLVYVRERRNSSEDLIRIGKLNLVDLAGSENIGKSGTDKNSLRTKESGKINQGLLTLGRVIKSLTEGSMHIPYRESKLTRLLRDSLGGKTKTCIIATISPSSGCLDETLSTLDYASIAKNIVNYPEPNIKIMNREGLKMLLNEIFNLKAIIESTQNQVGVAISKEEHDQFQKDFKLMKARINSLSEILHNKQTELLELKETFENKKHIIEEKDKVLQQKMSILTSNNEALNNLLEELNLTQQTLKEKDAIIQEHLKTERKFHEEAEIVLNVLLTTINDVEGLFNKVNRQDNVEELNRNYLDDFKSEMNNCLANLEVKMNAYYEFVIKENRIILEKIDQYHHSREASIKDLNTLLTKSEPLIKDFASAICEIYNTSCNNIKNIVFYVDKFNKEMTEKSTELDREFIEGTRNVILHLIQSSRNQSDYIKNEINVLDSKLSYPQKLVSEHFTEQSRKIKEIQNSSQQFSLKEENTLSECNDILSDLLLSQQQYVEQFKNTSSQRLNDLFMNYINRQNNETSNMVSSIDKDLLSLINESNELNSWYSDCVESTKKEYDEFGQQMKSQEDSLLSTLNSHKDSNSTEEHNLNEILSSLKKEIELLNIDHSHKTSEIKALIQGGSALSTENHQKLHELLNSYRQFLKETNNDLYKSTDEHKKSIDNFKFRISSSISGITNITKDDISTALKYSENIKENLSNFYLKNYEPTGDTPMKRTFDYPTKFTVVRRYSEILNEHRSSKLNM